jgi:hypothetical protein
MRGCLILLLCGCATPDAWKPQGPPEVYEGEDLFIYINGGAEIYHEYGFQRVQVQEYVQGNRSITLEIFEMDDDASAFGLYTFKRGNKGVPLDLGNEGRLEGYYINFWKGNRQVTLTGHDEDPLTVRGLKTLGVSAAAGIAGPGVVPPLVAALPGDGLLSLKYLKGPLGLMNCRADLFDAPEAVVGDYADGARIIVYAYPDEGTCRAAYTATKGARIHGRFIVVGDEDRVKSRLSF